MAAIETDPKKIKQKSPTEVIGEFSVEEILDNSGATLEQEVEKEVEKEVEVEKASEEKEAEAEKSLEEEKEVEAEKSPEEEKEAEAEKTLEEENEVDITSEEEPEQEELEQGESGFCQLHAALLLEPHEDGSMDISEMGGVKNPAPENVERALQPVKDNKIPVGLIAPRPGEVINFEEVLSSPELLENRLKELHIPYDPGKNIIVEHENGHKVAYCLNQGSQQMEQENDQEIGDEATQELEATGKIENRVRDVSSIDVGEENAIITAKDKEDFNITIDTINDSRESATMTRDQIEKPQAGEDKEAQEKGGYDMDR